MNFNIEVFDKLKKITTTFSNVPGNTEAVAVDLVRRTMVNETGTPSRYILIKKIKAVG